MANERYQHTNNTLTPEQARERYCPLLQPDGGTHCDGPRCMAWRWAGENADGDEVGYCGLAGRVPIPSFDE